MCIEVLKRRAGLGYRKTVTVYYFLLHYPTRDLQRSYAYTSYKQRSEIKTILVIQMLLKIEKYVHRWPDNRGSTVLQKIDLKRYSQ